MHKDLSLYTEKNSKNKCTVKKIIITYTKKKRVGKQNKNFTHKKGNQSNKALCKAIKKGQKLHRHGFWNSTARGGLKKSKNMKSKCLN